ncbi:hypothetical protein RclHR1_01890015 [Rhizophagus clarus]|uniref:Uncharacterized protein n=1 Tax=Rhizophagus clarus TaxID=94130 RepID=A0A2Z6R3L6_9GLOM|nr:hypothetical protein RclHR1_01890015 [Rhizophagus clarus]
MQIMLDRSNAEHTQTLRSSVFSVLLRDSIIITNPDLALENFMKFSQIVSSIKWNGPIIVMTDSTKLREKLVYAEELNYIAGSTLSHSETSIEVLEDIHPKINHILENNAIATQVRAIALKSQYFLLKRDVLNVDKQDDGAALRTFHSNNLMQILVNGTLSDERIGFFVYLFILGELCNAYLNRTIDHQTQIEMVLHAYFFLNIWENYIECCSIQYSTKWYSLQKNFISIQSYDIFIRIIDTNRERNSAADGTSLLHEIIERLRTWPTTDDIQECVRVAFDEATSLAKYIHIDRCEESLIPEFIVNIERETNDGVENDELNELMNNPTSDDETGLGRSITVGNAALEIARILSDPQNENSQLHEEENLDDTEEEEEIIQLPSVGEFPDIQYIIQHPQSIPASFHPFKQLFTDDILNIPTLLQIRQSHKAFSRNLKVNFNHLHQTTIDEDNNKINGNVVNKLITEITADNNYKNQRRRRQDRWEGRKRLETLSNNTLVTNLGLANISDIYPLCKNGFLIVYSNRILCLEKVIAMYEKCGQ